MTNMLGIPQFDLIRPCEELADPLVPKEAFELSYEALDAQEQTIIDGFKNQLGMNNGIVVLALAPDQELANFGRTYETLQFEGYDSHQAMKPYERHSIFTYTVDLDKRKIAHVKRIVKAKPETEREATGLTGLETVDDRLLAEVPEEKTTLEAIQTAHHIADIGHTWNITSNMTTERAETTLERPYALISYKAIFELVNLGEITNLFAYMNRPAIKSLGRLGAVYELLGGQEYHLPEPSNRAEYHDEYIGVCLSYTQENRDAFTKYNPEKPLTKLIANKEVPIFTLKNQEESEPILTPVM